MLEVADEDWNNSLNAYILAEGLAILPKKLDVNTDLAEEAFDWVDYQEDARDANKNLWKDGGEVNLDED